MSAYLTAADVASTLGVSTRTVLRWIDAGDLAAVRLPGGRLRVSQAALAEHLACWSTSRPTGAYTAPSDASGPGGAANAPDPGKEG
jgi:excisionase family DNA binding protein